METVYFWCASIAGSLFLIQTVLTLIGLGDTDLDVDTPDFDLDVDLDMDLDVDLDLDGAADAADFDSGSGGDTRFVGALSIKAIIAGVTVFGLAGMGASKSFSAAQAMLIATVVGGATMYAVGYLIQMMHRLNADGTAKIESSIGSVGSVYLPIPAQNSGPGKVMIEVQGRTMEYEAMTSGERISVGTRVEVLSVLNSSGTVEVKPVEALVG